jgi:AcrR family transcriptional regulator
MTKNRKPGTRNRDESREQILQAATREFAIGGFDGARVDVIAESAGLNKQLIYHYFGSKDELFTEVLERAYRGIREAEAALPLRGLRADEAIMKLVEFTWAYYLANPDFIRLLNSENQLEARHLKTSPNTPSINQRHRDLMSQLIKQGKREGSLRGDLNATQLSINIAALAFFYLMNRHTLSVVFTRDLGSKASLSERLAVMKDVILRWIKPA